MTGFLRVFVVMVTMLASWATGAWAATCSEITTEAPFGSFVGTPGDGVNNINVPLSLELGDRVFTRVVWSVDDGRLLNGNLAMLLRHGSQTADFRPLVAGIAGQTFNFDFTVTENTVASITGRMFFENGTVTPPAAPTTTMTARIFMRCVPGPRTPTTVLLSSSPNPSAVGQAVALVAEVSPFIGGSTAGTVEFFVDGASIGTQSVPDDSTVEFFATGLAAGSRNITAVVNRAPGFETSTSNVVVQIVGAVPTTTTVSSSPNPSTSGQNVVLTATVSTGSGAPTGTVEFFDDGNLLGSAPVSGGVATLSTTALAVGANNITASYSGAAGFLPSSSVVAVHSVNLLGVRMTLNSSLTPSLEGQAVTLRATANSATGPAAGVVEFREGATVLGTGTLDVTGVATLTSSALSVGSHPIIAFYLGNGTFAANSSSQLIQVVNALPNTTNFSKQLDDVQEAATGVAATLASDGITDSVAEEISAALSGQVQVLSASEGKVGLVYAPGIGKGTVVTPTADLATGETSIATWRIWTSLRYTDFDSSKLEGDQINALLGTSFLFGEGLTAGLVAGYEKQDYEDNVNATLKGEGFNIGGYAGGTIGDGIRFDAQVHTSFLNYDIASGPVTADTDATRLIVSGGFAHMMQFGATTFEPTARFNGTWEWQDGYTDSASVAHGSKDFNFGRIATGAKLAHRFDLGDGASFQPFVTGYADYRFSGGDATNESLMDGLSARVGVGAQLNTASGITASVLGEFSGLGLNDSVMVQSYKAQISIPF